MVARQLIVLALVVAGAAAECDMLKLCKARDAAGDISKVDCTKPALSSCAVSCNLAKSKYGASTPGAKAKITAKITAACDPILEADKPRPMKKNDFEKFWNGVCAAAAEATKEKVAAAGAARAEEAASKVEAGNTAKLAQKFKFKSLRGSMEAPAVPDVKKCAFCLYWDNLAKWCEKPPAGYTGSSCAFANKCKELNKDKPRDPKTGLCKTGKPDGGDGPAPQADPKTPTSTDPSPGSSGCASHSGKEPAKVAACCADPKCVPTKLGSCLTKENAAGQKAPLVACPGGGPTPPTPGPTPPKPGPTPPKPGPTPPKPGPTPTPTTPAPKKKGGGKCDGRDENDTSKPIWCACNTHSEVIDAQQKCEDGSPTTHEKDGKKNAPRSAFCKWDAKATGDFKCVPKPAGPVTRSQAANKKPAKCDPKKGVIVAPEGSTPNVVCCTKPGVKPAWKHKCRDVGKPAGDVEAPRSVCCKN